MTTAAACRTRRRAALLGARAGGRGSRGSSRVLARRARCCNQAKAADAPVGPRRRTLHAHLLLLVEHRVRLRLHAAAAGLLPALRVRLLLLLQGVRREAHHQLVEDALVLVLRRAQRSGQAAAGVVPEGARACREPLQAARGARTRTMLPLLCLKAVCSMSAGCARQARVVRGGGVHAHAGGSRSARRVPPPRQQPRALMV